VAASRTSVSPRVTDGTSSGTDGDLLTAEMDCAALEKLKNKGNKLSRLASLS